jgi:mono/diheme cytochrome c family protein
MKTLFIAITLLSTVTFANKEGKTLHDATCIACHIKQHDDDFYMPMRSA